MGVSITYMGTKREVAPAVCEVIRCCQAGILLDAFAGMCSVSELVAPKRQVWCNDAQVFASTVAKALFTSEDNPPSALWVADLHFAEFDKHRSKLSRICRSSVLREDSLQDVVTFESFQKDSRRLSHCQSEELGRVPPRDYSLFTRMYSNTYFGVRQAIEADSIYKSICRANEKRLITDDQKRWLIIALGRALLKVANTTGHFAQYLKPKESSYRRHLARRRRSLWADWLLSIGKLEPVGTADWRRRNQVFNVDSLLLLPALQKNRTQPSVVYADPPYTDDQYSRYYHILDTLVLYDYPAVSGAGLYRTGRFTTSFSLLGKTVKAFDAFISATARLGADLVLSYPSNGLAHKAGVDPITILAKHFRKVECCCSLPRQHSTFGASKGPAQSQVTELIYLAKT